jgi:hypothetical protein
MKKIKILVLCAKNPSLLINIIRKRFIPFLKIFYITYFWFRQKSIKRFDEIVKQKNVYFTIELEKAGFTDQLIQFIVFHNLGTSLNFIFSHTQLQSSRSFVKNKSDEQNSSDGQKKDQYEDVYDFLGLNKFFTGISHEIPVSHNVKTVNLDMENDSYFFYKGIAQKKNLATYLKLKLINEISSSGDHTLVRFRLKGHSSYFRMFNSSEEYYSFQYDLKSIYNKERESKPQTITCKKKSWPLFVHIRQGDTGVLKTPWNTYVFVWGIKNNAYKELSSYQDVQDDSIIRPDEFYSFIKDFLHCFDDHFFSVRIYSDGYQRTFQKAYQNKEILGWTDAQISQMKNHELTYDQNSFEKFNLLDGVSICIGEENTKLYELIHSVLHAKVVIIGTQQRMIPKLLSLYCNPSNMPLVIVLENKKQFSLQSFGREDLQHFFIKVDVSNYHPESISEKVKSFLKSRD